MPTPCFRVYKVLNSINGKLYIGITIRPLQVRWKRHVYDAKTSQLPLHRAIAKYGADAFIVEEIEICFDHLTQRKQEQYWIQFYNSQVPYGYNVTAGGEGLYGMRHSEATIAKMRKAQAGHPGTMTGKRHSEATKTLMRISAENRQFSEAHILHLRESHKGKPSSFKGKTHSEAAIQKNREAHKGKPNPNKGKTYPKFRKTQERN